MLNKYVLVVPSIARDLSLFLNHVDLLFDLLPIRKICIIGGADVCDLLVSDNRLTFVDERELIDIPKLKKCFQNRAFDKGYQNKFGWYLQQFLKIAYSKKCTDDYYLLWDSDTIPLKKVELFDENGYPFFDYKTEYHKPYFDTINLILKGLKKQIKYSFISEHMLINKSFMLSLIRDIEENDNLIGNGFEEKIINTISINESSGCSFSEFETYGNYVYSYFPNSYALRRWRSLRYGGFFFNPNTITSNDIKWLSKRYDAISFEKKHLFVNWVKFVGNPLFQRHSSPKILEVLTLLLRVHRKIISIVT